MNNTNSVTLQQWLRDYCSKSMVIAGGVALRIQGDQVRVLAEWPERDPVNQPLIDAGMIALKHGNEGVVVPPVLQTNKGAQRIVQVRLGNPDAAGMIVLGLNSANDSVAQGYLHDLQALKNVLNDMLASTEALGTGPSGTLLGLQATLLGGTNLEAAAIAFVNELASNFRLDRTSLGLLEDGRIRIAAISHNANFARKQELLRSLVAAMEECADQACTLTQPPRQDEVPHILLAHSEFSSRAGTSVCSLPIAHDGKLIGVLVLERQGTPPASTDIVACQHLAALMAPIIELRQKAERTLPRRLADTVHQYRHRLALNNAVLRHTMIGIAIALLALLLIPMPYQITAGARIEGAEQRILAAPTDGFLKQAYVRPGDSVKAGQLLAEMSDNDLRLEESRWQAELTQHENAYISAMARADRAGFSVSRAKANEASAQLELTRSQLERMRIVAPADSIVIQGDLSQNLGAPIRRGDTLLILAPQGRHRLLLEVDERDIAEIQEGRQGRLALSAHPDDTLTFMVKRIVPVAVGKDGNNVFELEAGLDDNPTSLRPGMRGVARIDADKHSLLWQSMHRVVNWLRHRLFALGG